ncbi:hypothetical protein [Actibacterium sp. D379-3]
MDKMNAIFELRALLREMERDIGIDTLTQAEKDVFLAARNLTRKVGDVVASDDIRSHELVRSLAQATYHRTLRALLKRGLLCKADGSKAKCYVVTPDMIDV